MENHTSRAGSAVASLEEPKCSKSSPDSSSTQNTLTPFPNGSLCLRPSKLRHVITQEDDTKRETNGNQKPIIKLRRKPVNNGADALRPQENDIPGTTNLNIILRITPPQATINSKASPTTALLPTTPQPRSHHPPIPKRPRKSTVPPFPPNQYPYLTPLAYLLTIYRSLRRHQELARRSRSPQHRAIVTPAQRTTLGIVEVEDSLAWAAELGTLWGEAVRRTACEELGRAFSEGRWRDLAGRLAEGLGRVAREDGREFEGCFRELRHFRIFKESAGSLFLVRSWDRDSLPCVAVFRRRGNVECELDVYRTMFALLQEQYHRLPCKPRYLVRVMVHYQAWDGGVCEVHSAFADNAWLQDILRGRVMRIDPGRHPSRLVKGRLIISKSDPHRFFDKYSDTYESDLLLGVLLDPFIHFLHHFYYKCLVDEKIFLVHYETKLDAAFAKDNLSKAVRLRSQFVDGNAEASGRINRSLEAFSCAIKERSFVWDLANIEYGRKAVDESEAKRFDGEDDNDFDGPMEDDYDCIAGLM
ncbi:MAG: hypothetical protein M1822_002839 [Bathelium mastoideum]|nr:MAG: hypothetical protein M1822_002839 [Bathelium mastoideum]